MKYYRYGKFVLSDYYTSFAVTATYLILAFISIVFRFSLLFSILLMTCAVIRMLVILVPNCEKFILGDDSITTFVGKKTNKIMIPLEMTLVVSYADICPPLATRTAIGNATHILKGKYAVSILCKMPLNAALEVLHRNYMRKYTTSTIQTALDECCYIYSFVCNQSQLDRLIANKNCQLIVPESLLGMVSFNPNAVDVYVDVGY